MSWSFSVPPTAKDDFADAVDDAVATGQPEQTPGLTDDVATAKEAMKSLGACCKRAKVTGSASGHCLQKDDGKNVHDGISVSVTGAE